MGSGSGCEPHGVAAANGGATLREVLLEGDGVGEEGAVGVGEAEEVVEEAVGPGGPAAKSVPGPGKVEEIVKGSEEAVDPGKPIAVWGGAEGADLVQEGGEDGSGTVFRSLVNTRVTLLNMLTPSF